MPPRKNTPSKRSQIVSSPTHGSSASPLPMDDSHLVQGEKSSDTRKRKWTSSIWQHYDIVDGEHFEDGISRATCKYCKSGPMVTTSSLGTSNFKRHFETCPDRFRYGVGDSEDGKFDPACYKEKVALAIIRHGYPFTYAEHIGNREIHRLLNKNFKPISRNTAKNSVMRIHDREKQRLKAQLNQVRGKICLTCDMWTSVVDQGYVSLTAHYIDDEWNLHAKILNFCHVEPPHIALVLHDTVFRLLKEWGIQKKVFTITLDNARCNDNMQDMLAESISVHFALPCGGEFFHVRCAAHVLNLIVQDGLKLIDVGVRKLRKMVSYVVGSERRLLWFKEIAMGVGIDCSTKLCLDCPTRWNSTYKMVSRALTFQLAFSNMRRMERMDPNFPETPTEEEWSRIKRICVFLKPFDDITTLMSGRKYPTANLYLKSVWRIESLLMSYANGDDEYLRDMARRMMVKFAKYWDDYSLILSFASMLDPRYKHQFVLYCFKQLDPEFGEAKAKHVRDKLAELFREYQSLELTSHVMMGNPSNEADIDELEGFSNFELSARTELDLYLEEVKLNHTQEIDVLVWWKENGNRFPTVSLMARDILAIPITTVASESAFSLGSRVITKWRSTLNPQTADALLTTRSWMFGFGLGEESNENQEIEGLEFQLGNFQLNTEDEE